VKLLAMPGRRICEVQFNHEQQGLVTASGLNSAAAAAEAGIDAEIKPACGMIDVSRMCPFSELLSRKSD
jgi:repressor of nif and glnA expression